MSCGCHVSSLRINVMQHVIHCPRHSEENVARLEAQLKRYRMQPIEVPKDLVDVAIEVGGNVDAPLIDRVRAWHGRQVEKLNGRIKMLEDREQATCVVAAESTNYKLKERDMRSALTVLIAEVEALLTSYNSDRITLERTCAVRVAIDAANEAKNKKYEVP